MDKGFERVLTLKHIKNGEYVSFPTEDSGIEVSAFRYNAVRMGGAPTITATIMYPSCLDNEWNDKVHVDFNGEKYYLKQTPTSSYSESDSRYKHEVEFVSERVILDNVYFYDAVKQGESQVDDKPLSNSTKFAFFGSIQEFANRLAASLRYSGLDYTVVVDEDVPSEEKLVSFEDQFFSNAIQEAYNTYDIPYYFSGKEIHFGYTNAVLQQEFNYGVDNELLSITKINSNYKTVNRVTGKGSTDNIPFYYPNNSAKGELEAVLETTSEDFSIQVVDYDKFSNKMQIDQQIQYLVFEPNVIPFEMGKVEVGRFCEYVSIKNSFFVAQADTQEVTLQCHLTPHNTLAYRVYGYYLEPNGWQDESNYVENINKATIHSGNIQVIVNGTIVKTESYVDGLEDVTTISFPIKSTANDIEIIVNVQFDKTNDLDGIYHDSVDGSCSFDVALDTIECWVDNGKEISLEKYGIVESSGKPSIGDTITQKLNKYVNTSQNLMPSIYRGTDGEERFYNAINYPFLMEEGYELQYGEELLKIDNEGNASEVDWVHNISYKDKDGNYYKFNNPFIEGNPKEHIVSFEDIKPTIKEATNSVFFPAFNDKNELVREYQRIDMFADFAYDEPDNDETYEDGEDNNNTKFKHSYFFAKLRKLPFNLFDHAIENQPMTISFTSGDCGACNFTIGVTEEYPQKNPVQVYEERTVDEDGTVHEKGSLKRDEEGRVICGVNGEVPIQECQQDTTKGEVWIALMKEEDTYGILMPKAPDGKDEEGNDIGGHRPKKCSFMAKNDGDTFVITGINLPQSYILSAEDKLKSEILKYIKENNEERFSFGIDFSRIYFAENQDVLQDLNENSRIKVRYNNTLYTLYVKSFSYEINDGDILPKISVELDENISINQNALQNAINEVKTEIGNVLSNIDVLGLSEPYFLRKDTDDEANGIVNFKKGIKFGEGGKVEILDNNSAKLSIEFLEVTKKATFTSLEIQEKTHVGGQMLITPAAINCGEVEEFDNYYRCYFQTKGANGDEIFNQFVVGDQAICQTFNAWGGKYYWRLVVGVGEDYIDLSKSDCDEGSDIPSSGDKIIQLGNRQDRSRQAAQVLSSYGENAPSFIMYNGINSFSLKDKNITGIGWNPDKQEPQMYSYGDFFFGDRNREKSYITFQNKKKEDGTYEEEKTLYINANVTLGSDSTGLSNLSEFKNVETTLTNIQDQIDGVVQNHFYEEVPTNNNYPAIEWVTDEDKSNHIGDTYINISSEEEDPENAGKAWRWTFTDSQHTGYHWHPIADTDAIKALLEAYKAQAGIDDLQYLKGTFGVAVDVDGVVISEMIAVKDGVSIKAFLNGSDLGKDNTHGKLILASGITNASNPSTSKTVLYEDGTMKTSALQLNNGCKIGESISISENAIVVDTTSSGRLSISEGGIIVEGNNIATIGNCGSTAIQGVAKGGSWSCASLSTLGVGGIAIEGNAANGDFAFFSQGGMFAGLRPKTKVISTTGSTSSRIELTNYDFSVLVNMTSGTCYLKLPSSTGYGWSLAQDGQEYYIESKGATLNIKTDDSAYSLYSGTTYAVDPITQSGRCLLRLKYYKEINQWILSWINRTA